MSDIESLLSRWQSAGVLDGQAAARIRAYETGQKPPSGLRWQSVVALVMGAILLACGVVLFVSAHWDEIGPGGRLALVMAMVAVFHIAGGLTRDNFRGMSTALHAVGTVATGAAIALVGQIFNIEEHWPAAILLWALAALASWILLHDEAQQTLTLLLVPAWIFSELAYSTEHFIGQAAFLGRFLFVWAILYLTFFLGSRRKVVQGILFGVGAVAALAGIVLMLEGWLSYYGATTLIPFGTRVWGWCAIAGLPLVIAAFKGHKGLIPPAAAVATAIALPWCERHWVQQFNVGTRFETNMTLYGPNLMAHVVVTALTIFLIGWGVRVASRSLVNLGIVGFAVSAGWFYWSDIFDKIGRSLGLIGLGILFLAGGWALEMTRRRLIRGFAGAGEPAKESQ
jgi:uncharacterized membrane protein